MTVLKLSGKILWQHVLSCVLALFGMYVFSWLLVMDNGYLIYACLFTYIYAVMIYSTAWNFGRLDARNIPGCYPDFQKMSRVAAVSAVPSIVLLCTRVISPFVFDELTVNIIDIIYRAWVFPCIGFISMGEKFSAYVLPIFIIPVFTMLGYFVGLKKFSIIEKLYPKIVYKREKRDIK